MSVQIKKSRMPLKKIDKQAVDHLKIKEGDQLFTHDPPSLFIDYRDNISASRHHTFDQVMNITLSRQEVSLRCLQHNFHFPAADNFVDVQKNLDSITCFGHT